MHLFAHIEGKGNNPGPGTLADLRQTFLHGSAMCLAAAKRATSPTTTHVIDVLTHPADEPVFELANGFTPAETETAVTAIAAELGIFTYSPDDIADLNDLLACLDTVCSELASPGAQACPPSDRS